ncbi:mRNA-decapping enzyme subunit 2 [Candida viswanathii]|uniref:mRNA-decapping enzyme subunit 2 n=1 Tax=Candida viswanathii TaxID=5486 RepID=A0A367YB35_9ASCO|nr:mRNA-decapping enzyme subunit 2 [Candida viswanathii]
MSIQLRDGLANQSLDRVLEDLLVRFVVNVPEEDLSSIERIMFQIEEAQWFYTDFSRQLNPELPPMKMKTFCAKILEKCPIVWQWGDPKEALSKFGKYKSTIPVRGVALFNKNLNKVVLVKGTESNSWSFPRGKISKDESDIDCAIREVEEETGFNCRHLINENDCVERNIKGKNYKIYLVKNVPEDTVFETPKYEISQIQWFDIKAIQKKIKTNPNTFFIVGTVFKPMMKWINKNKGVLNEEEIMLQVELKLKDLLGLNKPVENVDAGRELLNILQKVGQKDAQSPSTSSQALGSNQPAQPMFSVPVPQHLHNQIPFFAGAHAAFPFYNQPFFNPMTFAPPQFLPPHPGAYPHYQDQQPPNPQTFQKPKTNSKELLSILTTKSDKKKDEEHSKQKKPVEDGNIRSRAEHLLSVFPRKQPKEKKEPKQKSPTPDIHSSSASPLVNHHQEASNEIEESIRQHQNQPVASGKKIKLLKRSDNKASADLLNLLGHNKESPQPESSASNELLGLLHKSPQETTNQDPSILNTFSNDRQQGESTTKEKPTTANYSSANQLLKLLDKKKDDNEGAKNVILSALHPESQPSAPLNLGQQHQPEPTQGNASNQLLGLLQRNNGQERHPSLSPTADMWGSSSINTPNGKQFDLSNFATGTNSVTSPPALDIWATPQTHADPNANRRSSQLLELLNKTRSPSTVASPHAPPAPESTIQQEQPPQQQIPEDFDNFENFEDFEDYQDGYQFGDQFLDKTYRNFDIASDEEDVDHLIDPLSTQQDSTFLQQELSPPLLEQPKKMKILKPGETLDGLFGASQGTNEQGKGLLALLNGGKPPQ